MLTSVQTKSNVVSWERAANIPPDHIWQLNIRQYHAMIQAGILTDDDPVELLEGWLVTKMPKNPRHRIANRLVQRALEQLLPDSWYVDAQEPITLSDSEPEPDVAVIRGDTEDYFDEHPGPDDVAIVVEISDATLSRDQNTKKKMYAEAGIPIYWIVNLHANQIVVYNTPSPRQEDYLQKQTYNLSDKLPVRIEDCEIGTIEVEKLFPKR